MDMFEDQITSLLGHNGAGECSMSTDTVHYTYAPYTLHTLHNYMIHTHHVGSQSAISKDHLTGGPYVMLQA